MNSVGNARNAAYNDYQSSTTAGARSHVPSSFLGTQHGESFERDITPADSISNADYRSVTSSPQKVNGSIRTTTERRTERIRMSPRHNIRTHARSPTKEAPPNNPDQNESRGFQPPRVISRAVERLPTYPTRNEKILRESAPSRRADLGAVSDTNTQHTSLAPWKPQVSIVDHTTAALACRASIPPLSHVLPQSLEPKPLKMLSADEQEAAILDDLLYVFMGYEGQYIRFVGSYDPSIEDERLLGPSYQILPGLDPSLRDLTQSVLKMAKHYSAMEAFVEVLNRDEYGATNHALSASIRKVFKAYLVLIAQLEHQILSNPLFTLHLLHLHTLPTIHIMSQLYTLSQEFQRQNVLLNEEPDEYLEGPDEVADIIDQLRDIGKLAPGSMTKKVCKGGNILRLLTERLSVMSGDPAARTLLETLLRDASRPYMIMLNEWLHHGGIQDPYGEFLIREQTSIRREKMADDYTDQYWEKRYTVRELQVPPQLEGVKGKVLLAGKYLNVVRECGGVDVGQEVRDVPKSFDDPGFLDNVNAAYAHANSSLLNLLLTTHGLSDRLRSLKYYFFLDRSDFFTYFLDLSTSELEKPWKKVNVGKLQSLLDLVLRQPGSVAAQVPYKEDVTVHMSGGPLTTFLVSVISVRGFNLDGTNQGLEEFNPDVQFSSEADKEMNGFEALQFRYSVPFPLSLVISSNTLLRYQVLFRYLLTLRHLEEQLGNCWKDHHKVVSWTHRSKNPKLEMWKRRTWTLRAQMLAFVQQVTYHCTSEVIEPHSKNLMSRVDGTSDQTDQDGPPKPSRTVDELMKDHVDFLDTCLKECMLMNVRILKVISPPPLFPSSHPPSSLTLATIPAPIQSDQHLPKFLQLDQSSSPPTLLRRPRPRRLPPRSYLPRLAVPFRPIPHPGPLQDLRPHPPGETRRFHRPLRA